LLLTVNFEFGLSPLEAGATNGAKPPAKQAAKRFRQPEPFAMEAFVCEPIVKFLLDLSAALDD
jgi:hypothetical protein